MGNPYNNCDCGQRSCDECSPPVAVKTASALLGCPFCGAAPMVIDRASDQTNTRRVYFISCFCGGYSATAHVMGETAEQAAERWNTRAPC